MKKERYEDEYRKRIHKVQDYIEEHLGEGMSVETLAGAIGPLCESDPHGACLIPACP